MLSCICFGTLKGGELLVIECNGGGISFDLSRGQMDWIVLPLLVGLVKGTVSQGGQIKGSNRLRAFSAAHYYSILGPISTDTAGGNIGFFWMIIQRKHPL